MITQKFSKTLSLLLIGTLALALTTTVSAEIVNPATEYDGEPLQLITFFLSQDLKSKKSRNLVHVEIIWAVT